MSYTAQASPAAPRVKVLDGTEVGSAEAGKPGFVAASMLVKKVSLMALPLVFHNRCIRLQENQRILL